MVLWDIRTAPLTCEVGYHRYPVHGWYGSALQWSMGVSPVLEQAVSGRLFRLSLLGSMTLWGVGDEKMIEVKGD